MVFRLSGKALGYCAQVPSFHPQQQKFWEEGGWHFGASSLWFIKKWKIRVINWVRSVGLVECSILPCVWYQYWVGIRQVSHIYQNWLDCNISPFIWTRSLCGAHSPLPSVSWTKLLTFLMPPSLHPLGWLQLWLEMSSKCTGSMRWNHRTGQSTDEGSFVRLWGSPRHSSP